MDDSMSEGTERPMNESNNSSEYSPIEKAYNRYVSELRHEDSLVNHRLSWLLVFQGFLFASVGTGRLTAPLFLCVTAVGVFSSLFAYASIQAAITAWMTYHEKLAETLKHHFPNSGNELTGLFPQWKRSTDVINWGHWAPQGICLLFVAIWITFALLFGCGYLDNFFK